LIIEIVGLDIKRGHQDKNNNFNYLKNGINNWFIGRKKWCSAASGTGGFFLTQDAAGLRIFFGHQQFVHYVVLLMACYFCKCIGRGRTPTCACWISSTNETDALNKILSSRQNKWRKIL
jgi:hypothetical protein